ncbi:beta family protein [Brucella sp. 21LCYQ03]|nr:beta family protein [Brucella sp. 21LCYQ03]
MKYLLLLKSADAEIRAWKNLSAARKSSVEIHCEITRGRKKKNNDANAPIEYNISKIYEWISKELSPCSKVFVDITRESSLSSVETNNLSKSSNGYSAWVSAVKSLHEKNKAVRPTIIINPSDGDSIDVYRSDIISQFNAFSEVFDHISYRVSVLHDPDFIQDLEIIAGKVNNFIVKGGRFRVLLDFEYISPGTALIQASYAAELVREVNRIIPNVEVFSVGTSFPKDVTRIGGELRDEFRLNEVELNKELNRLQNFPVGYGDYGSINPERNDAMGGPGIFMRARIDYPTDRNTIFYHRVEPKVDKVAKKLLSPRSLMYRDAAKLVVADSSFTPINDSWGCDQVVKAARNLPEGNSPSFWISVRMEAHICRQIDRLLAET